MAELVYEEEVKFSNDLVVGDDFRIGDVLVRVVKKQNNDHDELVLHLDIVGWTIKKRSKMTLIIPKKIPIVTLK